MRYNTVQNIAKVQELIRNLKRIIILVTPIFLKTEIMNISDLRLGQRVTIKGILAEYRGIQKIKISGFGKVEKRVFQVIGINTFQYYSLNDGLKTLESEEIILQ